MEQRSFISIPEKKVPMLGEYDVIVVGGGPAGCAAALYAARHGANVLLIEKDGYLGGATVSQFVCMVLSTNGMDFQGVWHEYMNGLKHRNGVSKLQRYNSPYSYIINGSVDPEMVKYVWEELLLHAGVNLLFHSYLSEVIVNEKNIEGVVVEHAGGTGVFCGKVFIDCTGDGVAAHKAGVPWEQGDGTSKYAMACTKIFRLGNARKPHDFPSEEHIRRIDEGYKSALKNKEYTTPIITEGRVLKYAKTWRNPLADRPEMLVAGPNRVLNVDPLDLFDLTRAEVEGREQIWQVQDFFRRFVPGCEDSYFLDSSNHIGIRSTRRIRGREKVTAKDVIEFKKYKDSIARGSWDIDIWPANSYTSEPVKRDDEQYKKRIEKMTAGDYYDIRYGCLVAENIDNLLVAGRCISSEHIAQASLRIQQTCMSTGQAAGTAAAISLKEKVIPSELDPMMVAAQLETDRRLVKPAFEF